MAGLARYCNVRTVITVKDGTLLPASPQPPKLLDRLRRCIRDNHYSLRTERAYVYWARWYIRFHGLRHPMDMGGPEIQAFMSYLVNEHKTVGATYTQALCALLFLYRKVLQLELPWMESVSRPRTFKFERNVHRCTMITPTKPPAKLTQCRAPPA